MIAQQIYGSSVVPSEDISVILENICEAYRECSEELRGMEYYIYLNAEAWEEVQLQIEEEPDYG